MVRELRYQSNLSLLSVLTSVTLAGGLLTPASVVCAAVTGDLDLLELVVMKHRANQQRIVTWQGEAEVSMQSSRGETLSSVSFVFDRKQDATRWNWTILSEATGSVSHDQESYPCQYNGMRKDGVFFRYGSIGAPDADRLIIYPEEEAEKGINHYDLDPMWLLTRDGKDLGERLTFFRERAGKISAGWTVARDGDHVIVESGGNILNRYVFDLSSGGNLVSYVAQDSMVREEWEYRYEQQDGVSVPVAHTYVHTDHPESREPPSYTRSVNIVQSVINEPVEPDAFSLQRLGARKGDTVSDTRNGFSFKFDPESEGDTSRLPDITAIILAENTSTKSEEPEGHPAAESHEDDKEESMALRHTGTVAPRGGKERVVLAIAGAFLGIVLLGILVIRFGRSRHDREAH